MPRHKADFKLLGVKELDRAFKQLPRSVGKSVLRQALTRAAKPVIADAERNAPVLTGPLASSIIARAKLKSSQQRDVELPPDAAVVVHIGSTDPKAHLIEFGFIDKGGNHVAARPFLRPAWEANQQMMLKSIGTEIWAALSKAAKRLEKQARTGKLSKASRRHFGVGS